MSAPELRQDLVTGDWILISSKRGKRPDEFAEKRTRLVPPKKDIFANPEEAAGGPVILGYGEGNDWLLQIIPNKFPAIEHDMESVKEKHIGPYHMIPGVGFHDVVVTRHPKNNFATLPRHEAQIVFQAFKDRYHMLMDDHHLAYVSIFHNWGPKAGASVYHPHYQIIALPVVPPDMRHSLTGSYEYFKNKGISVQSVIIEWEQQEKKRIIFENKHAIAFAPYASREPFELRVYPKAHMPFFEDTDETVMHAVVEALQTSLIKLEKDLTFLITIFLFGLHHLRRKNGISITIGI